VRGRAAIALGVGAGIAAGGAVITVSDATDGPAAAAPRARVHLAPPPARPALAIPAPTGLDDGPDVTRWAHVRTATVARSAPRRGAAVAARVAERTPEGTDTVVPVTGRREDAGGRLWLRVTLPVLPNGTRGWVPRRALGGYRISRDKLVIDLAAQRLTLLRRGKVALRAPVGVGQARWPTPRGHFIVRNRLERFASPTYGPVAFGTSARSATLTDWPSGGFIGIHGTDQPGILPGRVSHGCIRLRNPAILRLARLMPVGTPVEIR
jgi:lipoprotein-anchoring transpeptidase ErfK/SrfK